MSGDPRRKRKILTIIGTRPEIIKMAPLLPLLDKTFKHCLVHTGQHYDDQMDKVFFRELKLREPKYNLKVGSLPPAKQVGVMLENLEPILTAEQPDAVVVQGDTNSALAGCLAASKAGIPVYHVEAGCRSFNRHMPEEQNRIVVDHLSDLLFAADLGSAKHLKREGIAARRIQVVGNTGLDSAQRALKFAPASRLKKFGVRGSYVLATLHRAENTDSQVILAGLVETLNTIAQETTLVFPLHPRTQAAIERFGLQLNPRIVLLPPLGNLDFLALLRGSTLVLSDSGGIQEEAAVVNKPVLILREQTEWTRLVTAKKNFLVGTKPKRILKTFRQLMASETLRRQIAERPAPLLFGASQKIVDRIEKTLRTGRL